MKASSILLLLCLVTSLYGCIGCFDVIERTYWSDKSYIIMNDPSSACKTLYHKLESGNAIGRISCITQLGDNEEYIIAASFDPEVNQKQYWILNKLNDRELFNAQEIVEGPYTIEQFEAERKKLKIEQIPFSKHWK